MAKDKEIQAFDCLVVSEVKVIPFKEGPRIMQAFDCIAVSEVDAFPFKEGPSLGHLKGVAQIVLNDQMVIRGLRIMEGENGLFVCYPVDPFFKGDDFKYIASPITRQLREHIENVVIEKYKKIMKA